MESSTEEEEDASGEPDDVDEAEPTESAEEGEEGDEGDERLGMVLATMSDPDDYCTDNGSGNGED